ncbi:MAG: gephyrin-like molybdotransferase Glp [Pseudomonadota bacterium]
MVDWSGGNQAPVKPTKDAIWACIARGGTAEEPVYLRNRELAEAWIINAIEAARARGEQVLVGFDFPFGYPTGFARALTGQDDPFALWDWVEARIEDSPTTNNRFDVAAEINAMFPGIGPFWGNGLKRDIPHLPRRGSERQGHGMPERRAAERIARGAFPVWQLSGAGAVGGQVLMGLPVLNRLRRRWDTVCVWPFEALDGPIALVEIWPSLTVGQPPEGWIKDAWQVHEVARITSGLPADRLAQMLDVPPTEEGWILGLGFEDQLAGAPEPPRLKNDCFALPPGIDWAPVDDALQLLRERLVPVVGTEILPLNAALGRTLAADVVAKRANPPHSNTAVDGYGFAGGRDGGVHRLRLMADRAAAGSDPGMTVPNGHAIRVLTGAALPEGVDTVVLQEDVSASHTEIAFRGPVTAGANTRKAGEDVRAGETITRAGKRLAPADLALLAATGCNDVAVHRPLRVAILSTGDELVEAGERASAGQIHDANRPMLLGLVLQMGHQALDLGRVPDDRAQLKAQLDHAASRADVILTSGGASAGDEDHVSALLREANAMELWRIAIKPGRPLALGMWQGKPVFGLPGNPVAAMVCTLVFAAPALAVLGGRCWPEPQGYLLPAAFKKRKQGGRREFLRARVRNGQAEVFASEGSGRISGLSWAEGLVELPDEAVTITLGDPVRFIPWDSFIG